MKIRVFDRIVLFLLALISLVIGICGALNEFHIDVMSWCLEKTGFSVTPLVWQIIRIAGIAVLVILSIYLFRVAFRHKKKADPFISMESGTKGSIRMSMESISSLVEQTCRQIPGLTNLKVATINHEDSVGIDMAFQVEMNSNIPELSAHIQQIVGEIVEKNCGVAVRNVCVTVSGFTAPQPKVNALPEKKGFFHHKAATAEEPQAVPAPTPVSEPETEEQPAEPVEEAPVKEAEYTTEEPVIEEDRKEAEVFYPEEPFVPEETPAEEAGETEIE